MECGMRNLAIFAFALFAARVCFAAELERKTWIHGSADCSANREPAIEVFRFDAATYILRQNKCVHVEAPFIYVLFGAHTVFVQDTGATAEPEQFPLYDTVQRLIHQRAVANGTGELQVLVTHSHSHGDHIAADAQFRGRPRVTLIEPRSSAVRKYFAFTNWPDGEAKIDLGGRELIVMPIPGHQQESIAVYDSHTGWLLTGDTVYPGRLYVSDWDAFRASTRKLAAFAETHRVSALMGTHIEMSNKPGVDYPMGSTYQPDEAPLPLRAADLASLDKELQAAGTTPEKIVMAKFIVAPLSLWQRVLSAVAKWFKPD
jgi:hydroxyacylglutathione hydrolase